MEIQARADRFCQTYFAVQTRIAELIEQRLLETERVQAREKLKQTEKLSEVIHELTGGGQFCIDS